MGKLVAGAVLLLIAFFVMLAAATLKAQRPGPLVNLVRFGADALAALGAVLVIGSTMVVIVVQALTKQYIEVLHDMRSSNNRVIFVPTEGGLPLLNVGDLRRNMKP